MIQKKFRYDIWDRREIIERIKNRKFRFEKTIGIIFFFNNLAMSSKVLEIGQRLCSATNQSFQYFVMIQKNKSRYDIWDRRKLLNE
jgi:hypothetical protein